MSLFLWLILFGAFIGAAMGWILNLEAKVRAQIFYTLFGAAAGALFAFAILFKFVEQQPS